jgi:hypothetical protein
MSANNTPLTDKEEIFIIHEAKNFHGDGWISNREGFVSSEFARKLERRINELVEKLNETNKMP